MLKICSKKKTYQLKLQYFLFFPVGLISNSLNIIKFRYNCTAKLVTKTIFYNRVALNALNKLYVANRLINMTNKILIVGKNTKGTFVKVIFHTLGTKGIQPNSLCGLQYITDICFLFFHLTSNLQTCYWICPIFSQT